MIAGIGCDIIEISRIKKALRDGRFAEKCFTASERAYFAGRGVHAAESAAACFAAKEAVSKALGTGISGFCMTDIEVLHNGAGQPYVRLYNNAASLAAGARVHLSLSHCREYAAAYAVAETQEKE